MRDRDDSTQGYGYGWAPPSHAISVHLARYAEAVREDERLKTPETWATVKQGIVNLCDEIHTFARRQEPERLLRSDRFAALLEYVECLEAWANYTEDDNAHFSSCMGVLKTYGWDESIPAAEFIAQMRRKAFPPTDIPLCPACISQTTSGGTEPGAMAGLRPALPGERCSAPDCVSS